MKTPKTKARPKAKRPNNIAAWRDARGLTQEEVAEAIGTNGAQISLLESGARKLTKEWLERLAVPLRTTPGHLLDYNPETVDIQILDLWSSVPQERRAQALQILKTFGDQPDAA